MYVEKKTSKIKTLQIIFRSFYFLLNFRKHFRRYREFNSFEALWCIKKNFYFLFQGYSVKKMYAHVHSRAFY